MTDSKLPNPEIGRLLIFTATYNEHENIREFCHLVLGLPMKPDLLVVDDNSPDGTGSLLDELAAEETRITVIHRPHKLGLGSAHLLAFAYAEKRNYDTLVTMDADFSHDPLAIPELLEPLKDGDFVIGSRYVSGGTCDYTGYRKIISIAANLIARVALGIPLHEVTTSFRAIRVSLLRELKYSDIGQRGYSFFLESVWKIHCGGWRTREVPIHFSDRQHGVSKIPRHEIFNGLLKLLELFSRRLLRQCRPAPAGSKVQEWCSACGSDLTVEGKFNPGLLFRRPKGNAVTRKSHGNKPRILHCLECGFVASENSQAN